MMTQSLTRKQNIVVLFMAVCGIALFVSAPKAFALYSTSQINAKLENGTASAVGWDSGYCRTNLYNNISVSGTNSLRASINGDGSYKSVSYIDKSWLSAVGVPNTNNPVTVAWGATSVPLQINSVTFICGALVSPETYGPSPALPKSPYSLNLYKQTSRWVLSASNANDRVPNPIGGNNMRPARVDTYTQIVGFSVSGRAGASLSGSGSTLYIKRDNGSRYWFAAPVRVTYNDPAGITQLTTVKITMTYKPIQGYWGYTFPPRAEACVGVPGTSRNLSFSDCGTKTSTLTVTFKPNPALSATTVASPKTIYPTQSSTFTHTIREVGTRNASFYWQTCGGWYAAKPAANVAPPTCTGRSAGSATTTVPYVRKHVVAGSAARLFTTPWYCERIVYFATATSGAAGASVADCFKMQPLRPACGTFSSAPDTLDPKTIFSVTTGVIYPPAIPIPAGSMTLKITPASGGATWTYTSPARATPAAGPNPIEATFTNIGPTNQTGVWNVNWTYTDANGSVTCGPPIDTEAQLYIANKPYLKVYGGDVLAGTAVAGDTSGSGQSCVTNDDGGVYSWNNHTVDFSGAGSQYAVMALGQILDFASAIGAAGQPGGLSFANYGLDPTNEYDITQGLFGGKFGGTTTGCDFTSDITVAPNTTSDMTIGATAIATATQDVRYVIGHDVYISGNIMYSSTGGWTSIDQIPYFKLVVVGGNIYIGSGVTQLDGVYVAEQDENGNGGIIYTCATGLRAPVNPLVPATFNPTCKQQLTITGAFAAQQVQFLRTFGTVGSAGADTWSANNAAEVFRYSPEVWLPRSTTKIGTGYDAITGLPPVL
jgi:hypothetical protein